MERKRLRVDGIPNDIPAERAKDKLTIHFLRNRNGGGELEEIEMFPGPPLHAIVTFEDDEVVERVLKMKSQILEIKGKTYSLQVSKVTGKLDLDEVFQKSSLTVNYKILSKSLKNILKSLRNTYKEVKFDFDENAKTCEIRGSYTEIQTLSQEIIRKLGIDHAGLNEDPNTEIIAKTDLQLPRKQSDLPDVPQVGDYTSSPYSSAKQANYYSGSERFGKAWEQSALDSESLSQEFISKLQTGDPCVKEELKSAKADLSPFKKQLDLSDVSHQEQFVWDSDIYKYMKRFHGFQYEDILKKNNVQAVDERTEDITIIFLQADHNKPSDLRTARHKLMELYQYLELILRKEQMDKRDLIGAKDLKKTLKDIQLLFPRLLFHEDERHLFLIGSSSDVALGKKHINDMQLKSTRHQGMVSAGHQMNTAEDKPRDFMTSLPKYDRHESKGGSRIAATFYPPIDSSSYSETRLHERYLTSISKDRKQPFDHESSLVSDKTLDQTDYTALGYPSKAEDLSVSKVDEKSESKMVAPIRRLDVVSALKTGREDIRQGKGSTKTVGPLKPVRITKASSEVPCSSLVDLGPTALDFKLPEHKLRRSNSLPRFYSNESSSSAHEDEIFKDNILIEDWMWHYIKEFYKSDIDVWCTEISLTEEMDKEIAVLKLKSASKNRLWKTKHNIQELHEKIRMKVTRSRLQYSDIGVRGSDDPTVEEWCSVFRRCSNQLCVMLKKEMLLLIYPTVLQQTIASLVEHTTTSPDYLPLTNRIANSGQYSPVISTYQQQNELANSGGSLPKHYLNSLDRNDLKDQEDFAMEVEKSTGKEDLGTPLIGGLDNIVTQDKPFFNSLVSSLQENTHMAPQQHEPQNYLQGCRFFENPDCFKSEGSEHDEYQADLFASTNSLHDLKVGVTTNDLVLVSDNSSSAQEVNTFASNPIVGDNTHLWREKNEESIVKDNAFERPTSLVLRSPAVGQESEKLDGECDHCKTNGKVNKLSCGHLICDNCPSASMDLYCVCCDSKAHGKRNTVKATMSYKSMSLILQGYERTTALKIKYEVLDGVQGAEDPHPGQLYRGGTFEAFLPDNPEGNKLLVLYEKALKQGLTFHVKKRDTGDIVAWHRVPHKTSPDGGKAKSGYPDAAYIRNTFALLKDLGIE